MISIRSQMEIICSNEEKLTCFLAMHAWVAHDVSCSFEDSFLIKTGLTGLARRIVAHEHLLGLSHIHCGSSHVHSGPFWLLSVSGVYR